MYMKVVEKLLKEEDFLHFVDIVVGAYPGRMGSSQPTFFFVLDKPTCITAF